MSDAVRDLKTREAVKEVLRQCNGHLLLEKAVMREVNLELAPAASPKEIAGALDNLLKKGLVEFECDAEDARIKRWRIHRSVK